ncbi:ABC transporter substrate-binding protein [Acidisoma sp. S159]|jgi:peptide/nickel transport system substrate-binding protein|uniref:ABC transporter substrate-binding protein n=1 Tax=Acidisoma sp. S159 TaxID=1747225 RepID=UPI00131D9174|nr:ABC transporter substrate-binding protein [Acidisoma sp. S159]
MTETSSARPPAIRAFCKALNLTLLVTPLVAACALPAFASDTPRYGGTIVLATLAEPVCLDPTVGGDVPQDIIAHQFLDSLISQDEDGSYHPWLAKSWEVSPDGLRYTFHLRNDVKFTDGTPFNAAAVKANFNHWLDPKTGSANIAPELTAYAGTQIVDDDTAIVTLKTPVAFFLTTLANPSAGIQSPKAIARGNTLNCESPVGSGPFIVQKWVRGSGIFFTRNENYNSPPPQATHHGKAYAEKVEWRIIQEPATRYNALASGDVGVINGLPPENYIPAKSAGNVTVIDDSQPGVPWEVDLNTKRAPFNDLLVRQAFRHAINPAVALRSLFFGAYKPVGGPLSPDTPFYDASFEHAYPYDIATANKLLDQAGWTARDSAGYRTKDGKRLTVHFPVYANTQPADVALFEQLQATAKKAGFDVKIEEADRSQVHSRQYTWDYDLYIDYWTVNTPGALKFIYDSEGLTSIDGGYHNNEVGLNNKHIDELLDRGEQVSDHAEQQKIYSDVQKYVSDQALFAPLYVYPSLAAFNTDKVRGVRSDWSVHSVTLYDAWVPQG